MKLSVYGHITRTTQTAYDSTLYTCKPYLMIAMNTFKYYQPNPTGQRTRDCVIRAISAALDMSWDDAFDIIAERAKQMGTTMDENAVYGSILRQCGFYRAVPPNNCPDCFTARDFCLSHPHGVYVLGFTGHVATVIDGQVWDSFDSTDEIVNYYWGLQEGD